MSKKVIRLTEGQLKQVFENQIKEYFGGPSPEEKIILMNQLSKQIDEILMRKYFTKDELINQISRMIKRDRSKEVPPGEIRGYGNI